jgi:cellobiose epimerase
MRTHSYLPSGRLAGALLFALAAMAGPILAQDLTARAKAEMPELQRTLDENITAFWLPRSLDRENGGYHIQFGPKGEKKGPGNKMIVTQARMVWYFARLARSGYAGPQYTREQLLEAAEHGYQFLRRKMWDRENGGFYWEVDATGDEKLKPGKHLYGQSFALYALGEYYLASRKAEVLDFAIEFFQLLESKSYDRQYGGYIEFFSPDWSPVPANVTPYMGGGTGGMKLMNTHLHLMEAMTTFYRASQLPLARQRLMDLIAIQSSAVVRKGWVACTDKYERDWTPVLEGDHKRVSYGHDLENIWLLVDASQAAGISTYPFLDLYKELFSYSMKHGWDAENGGFYDSGMPGEKADRTGKVWWVQAEALVSALMMHKLTKDPQYLEVFLKTWDFTKRHQIDWETGEWHPAVDSQGVGQGDKASVWKAGYHNGRAMIECLDLLKEI